ncbi:hypothetical protein V6N12_028077 [Hibiscus sabdariffa]|uniref:Uncharacterized protein n=1 Tax=Hibiscus sabdariffa TaxID=183260 RepID=A0ABR2F4R8_9ROSI
MSDDTPAPPCAWIAKSSTMFHGGFLVYKSNELQYIFQIYSDEEPFEPSAACMPRSAALSLMQSSWAESCTFILRK